MKVRNRTAFFCWGSAGHGRAERGAGGDRGEAAQHCRGDVGQRGGGLAALPQAKRVEAERRHGGEAAEDPGHEEQADIARDRRHRGGDQPDREAAGEVDGERGERAADGEAGEIAQQGAKPAADEHQCRGADRIGHRGAGKISMRGPSNGNASD